MEPGILIVSHTHWDREWYRTFEAFRAHLVDTVDRVLDQLEADPEWRFLLDGQAIVLEDYLTVRPSRRDQLAASVSSGRLAVGPWYVQPDSLLPSGESHVRNLLEGREVARSFGRVSRVAYAPDSFGHPAQFPQLFAGFGLGPFVYWRGNGDEIDRLGPVYRWEAPDGSSVLAYALLRGYFSAAGLPADPEEAAEGLAASLGEVERAPIVLMNGVDHAYPQDHTGAVAAALADRTGREVGRGVLDDLVDAVDSVQRQTFRGELLGGRLANLLPGVWSSRLGSKLANRSAECALFGWAEPWVALGTALGLAGEAPSLRTARRALLANQAHDSIGGCSQDEVHRQMTGRSATAIELADQTTRRMLERIAGLDAARRTPWDVEFDVAVFNPSPRTRTDVLRIPLDGYPLFDITYDSVDVHPLSLAGASVAGYEADGRPVRVVRSDDPGRVRMVENVPPLDLELVVGDVPAFGWRRVHLAPTSSRAEDEVDDGSTIENDTIEVRAGADGTLALRCGDRCFDALGGIEDLGDRGDTYDFDPVDRDQGAVLRSVRVERRRHRSGIQRLVVTRAFDVPAAVAPARDRRVDDTVVLTVRLEARVAPRVDRVDLHVETDNPARDHRLRLLFPTGASAERFLAATTFDVAERTNVPPPATGWWHVPPDTFPHQGWVSANGLTVGAPGLPEATVTPDGVIAVTLLRAIGWLSHLELRRRPIPAGPTLLAPDAQCREGIAADLTLRVATGDRPLDPGVDAATAVADELGLRAVPAGKAPLWPDERSLLRVDPASVVLSTLKPAEDGDGMILRVLNPTGAEVETSVVLGLPVEEAVSVRLDETADGGRCQLRGPQLVLPVGPHALRSVRLRPIR
jgi:mannosylglycerate hydrolase